MGGRGGGSKKSGNNGGGGGEINGRITAIDSALHKEMIRDMTNEFHEKHTDPVSQEVTFHTSEQRTSETNVVFARATYEISSFKPSSMSREEYSRAYTNAAMRATAEVQKFNSMKLRITDYKKKK